MKKILIVFSIIFLLAIPNVYATPPDNEAPSYHEHPDYPIEKAKMDKIHKSIIELLENGKLKIYDIEKTGKIIADKIGDMLEEKWKISDEKYWVGVRTIFGYDESGDITPKKAICYVVIAGNVKKWVFKYNIQEINIDKRPALEEHI